MNVERWQPIYWCYLECAEDYKSLLISGHLTGTGWDVLAVTWAVSQVVDSSELCPSVKLTCGFSGSEGGIIVCTDLDPWLDISGTELGARPACAG